MKTPSDVFLKMAFRSIFVSLSTRILGLLWFQFLVLSGTSGMVAEPAVFQYRVDWTMGERSSPVFLWIPPESRVIRGVFVSAMTLAEREWVQDPRIRQVCREESIAIVFALGGRLHQLDIPALLEVLANVSGYRELAEVPVFLAGHSAAGPAVQFWAGELADRCFGIILYRGGTTRAPNPVPEGMPTLVMIGQYDEFSSGQRDQEGNEGWVAILREMTEHAQENPGVLASLLVEPGAGHFAWSERNSRYVSLFLKKACEHGLVDSADGPAFRKQPAKDSGWLTRLDPRVAEIRQSQPSIGNGGWSWHFDRELAEATLAYHEGFTGRLDQFLDWKDAYTLEAGARRFFSEISWEDDGQTFRVHPVRRMTHPEYRNVHIGRWDQSGDVLIPASLPVYVRPVSGPVVSNGESLLRIRYSALSPVERSGRITFLAYCVGNEAFRPTEVVGMLPHGFMHRQGEAQTIRFPAPDAALLWDGPVRLEAVSDSTLTVEYYVAYGPAQIEDGYLHLAEVPLRASFPMAIEVVAWQFGRQHVPYRLPAEPVRQLLWLPSPTSG